MQLLKKLAIYVAILLAVIYGYQLVTGKSIATLPRDIANALSGQGSGESTNPHYYKDPAKRYPGIDDDK